MSGANKVRSWSYSSLTKWETCPYQFKLEKIDRVKVEMGEPLKRGIRIHEEAEAFLKKEIPALPGSLVSLKPEYERLRGIPNLEVERQLAFRSDWSQCEWMDRGVWLRCKIDLAYYQKRTVYIDDHKTGKIRSEQKPQLQLYGLVELLVRPKAKEASARFLYADQGQIVNGDVVTRDEVPALKQAWETRVAPMFADTVFLPKQNYGCRWCPHSKVKGGPCVF